MRRIYLLLAALVIVCPVTSAHAKDPSHVIFPEQQLPIKFSHKQHFAFKLDCDFCHDSAPNSVTASDNLIPSEDSCSNCHKIDRDVPDKAGKPAARCTACHEYANGDASHPNQPLRVDMPAPNIKFNHKVHADRDIKCERCHGTMRDVESGTRKELPTMPLCLGCHNSIAISRKAEDAKVAKNLRSPAKCTTCHIQQADQTLQTEFPTGHLAPSGTLKGDAHTLDFTTHHSQVGRDEAQYCENCHRKDFCLSCHNGVVKPLGFHGNDYLSLHSIEARKATLNCDGCHRRQTFCLGCHERSGVTDALTLNGTDAPNSLHNANPPRRFHPPYAQWTSPPRTAEHHSWQAERNIKQCVSCHREDSCIQCHATAGVTTTGVPAVKPFNVNPHPPGFAGSRQCESVANRNGRVCLKCHATDDAHLSCQ